MHADVATLIHANADRIRAPVAQKIPAGEGVVWDASKLACDEYIKNFCPYVYLGNGVRGLCWFADNDRGWGWNPQTPNLDVRAAQWPSGAARTPGKPADGHHGAADDLFRAAGRARETDVERARQEPARLALSFPARQLPRAGHRHQLARAGRLWLGLSGRQDMSLWQAIKKGNAVPLNAQEMAQVIARGKRYFEPYGKDAVEMFVRHAQYNCTTHYDAKMVFYYNRASCQLFDEFETFKDEWCLDDFRTIGKGTRPRRDLGRPHEVLHRLQPLLVSKILRVGRQPGRLLGQLVLRAEL